MSDEKGGHTTTPGTHGNPAGTDGNPTPPDDRSTGSRGTQGYPPGTEGNPTPPNDRFGGSDRCAGRFARADGERGGSAAPDDRRSGSAGPEGERSGSAGPEEEQWWRKLGFGSRQEYLRGLEEHQALLDRWFPSRTACEPPSAAPLPGDEIADLPPRRRRAPVRQVGIKLRPVDYESLARAAYLYGVRPSTMARMLVNRGVRAVLEKRAGQQRTGQ